jgi:hypothetical protein
MDKTATGFSVDYGNDESSYLRLITPGYGGPATIPIDFNQFDIHWREPSPPIGQSPQRLKATHSALGNDVVVYGATLTGGDNVVYGYSPDGIAPFEFPCFVGVNIP